jgi:IS605 OrfB family transposase
MKTIIQVKLQPTLEQTAALIATMERFNAACNYISAIAFEKKCFSKFSLHKIVYYDVKERFELTAQVVVRAIGKTIDSYRLDKKVQHSFRKHGAIIYDQRIMSFKGVNKVSLWTIDGRQTIPMIYGEYQKARWFQRKGQADLVYKDNKFYLLISVETEEQPPIDPEGFLGVDLGIAEIATTSEGESFSGKQIDNCRERFQTLRSALQKCGSKSAKRHLKKISNKESNFRKHTNHCISKQIVEKAKRSLLAIVLEDLKGIRGRMKARKSNRSRMHGWSFYQLRVFITYKAMLAGIPVHVINPAYTSQRCSECGHTHKTNRKSQSEFVCKSCGFVDNADHNASKNIALLGVVNHRIVGGVEGKAAFMPNCA